MAYVCIQCHAFRRINHRSIMSISTINNKGILSRFSHHKINTQLKLIYTIRGGSDEYNNNNDNGDDNQYNNGVDQYDDEYIDDFISSFEVEMANIRREAELEAENEMQKLRGLIDRRVEEDIQEEEEEVYDIGSEDYDETDIESNENEQLEDDDTAIEVDDSINDKPIDNEDEQIAESEVYQDGEELDNAITDNEGEEEELITIQDRDTLVDDSDRSETEESDEELSNDMEIEDDDPSSTHDDVESEDTIDLDSDTEDEISGETVMVEDDDYLPYDEITELPNESVVFGDYSDESEEEESDIDTTISIDAEAATPEVDDDKITEVVDEEIISDDIEEIIEDEIIQEVKSKTSKKGKKKFSKQGKEKKKIRITESEDEEDLSDGKEVAVGGDSVMLTQTEDEVAEPRQSGLLYYLRSDLARALCLFAATVALAIITKRMERQLLAAEAAEAASSST